jgi:hypothetical protein
MNNFRRGAKLFWKGTRAFFLFWKDFLVGDSPELALGVLIILGIAFWLHSNGVAGVIAVIALVLLLAIVTVWRKTIQH